MDTPTDPYKLGVCTIYPPAGTKTSWRIRFTLHGRRQERTANSKAAADQAAMDITAKAAAPSTSENVTVAHLAQSYLSLLGDGRYRARQEGLLRLHLLPHLGPLLILGWRPVHSRQALQAMIDKGLSKSRVKNAAQTLRGLISHAQSHGWFTAADDPMLKVWPQLRFPYVEDEAEVEGEAADYIDRDTLPTRHDIDMLAKSAPTPTWGLAWRLASYSGLRWGEIIGVRGMDVDLENRIVYVRRSIEQLSDTSRRPKSTKNKKIRFSIFPASLVPELQERKEAVGPEGLMFPGDDGDFAERTLHHRRWIRAAQAAGWPFVEVENPTKSQKQWPRPRWTFHDLRHHAACWMIFDLKAPLADVTTWLGHHAISFTFDKYVGRRGDLVQKGLDLTEDW